jgi:O-antigen ligase
MSAAPAPHPSPLPRRGFLRSEHGIPIAVAVVYVIVAASGGGYSLEFRTTAAVAVWAAVAVGLGLGFWPRARVPAAALGCGAALLGLALLSAFSTGWASDDGVAFAEAVRVAGYLGVFVLVVVAAPAGSAGAWLSGLAIGLVVVAGLALGSRIEPSLFPEQDLNTLLPSVKTRLSYPLNYWNGLAACMAMACVLLVWLGGHAATRGGRALAVGALPVPALALFLTSSRGGVVALAAGLLALFAVGPARARMLLGAAAGGAAAAIVIVLANSQEKFVDGLVDAPGAEGEGRAMLAALVIAGAGAALVRLAMDRPLGRLAVPRAATAVTALALAVAAAFTLLALDPAQRLDEFNDPPADPGPARGFVTRHLASAEGSGRYQFWETGLDAFAEQPVRGIGAGGYESWWAQHGSVPYYIRDAHSLPVELLAELGLLGLLALVGFFAVAAVAAVRRTRDARAGPAAAGGLALLACGATSAAIDWSWELPAAFGPAVVAAAVVAGPALSHARSAAAPRFGLGVATLALAWIALVASALVLAGEIKLKDSRAAVARGDLDDAVEDARAARAIVPWSGAPRLQLALVHERRGDLPAARRAALDAAERDGDDWRVWLVVTRLAVKAGDVEAARSALRRARQLNPRSTLLADPSP